MKSTSSMIRTLAVKWPKFHSLAHHQYHNSSCCYQCHQSKSSLEPAALAQAKKWNQRKHRNTNTSCYHTCVVVADWLHPMCVWFVDEGIHKLVANASKPVDGSALFTVSKCEPAGQLALATLHNAAEDETQMHESAPAHPCKRKT